MRRRAAQSPDEINAGQDVAPLIAAAHLQCAFVSIVQHQKIVCLQQRITEFGKRNAFIRFQAAG